MKNLFILLCLPIFVTCTSTKKNIGDNSTERKYNVALSNLQSGNSTKRQIDNLTFALTEMVTTNEIIKDSLHHDMTLDNKEFIYDIDLYLIDKIHRATPYISGLYSGKMDSLKIEQQQLQAELRTTFLNQGHQDLKIGVNENNRSKAQAAYNAFEKAKKYGAEVEPLLKESMQHSLTTYNFKAIAAENRYQILVDERFVGVEDINRKFKKFYYRNDNANENCTIIVAFDRFQKMNDERRQTKSFQKQVQTGTRTETDANGNEKEVATFSTVYGTAVEVEKLKTFTCQIKLSATSTSNNCDVTDKLIVETLTVSAKEINVSGDERALPQEYQHFTPQILPMDRDIVEQLIEQAYQRIQSELFI